MYRRGRASTTNSLELLLLRRNNKTTTNRPTITTTNYNSFVLAWSSNQNQLVSTLCRRRNDAVSKHRSYYDALSPSMMSLTPSICYSYHPNHYHCRKRIIRESVLLFSTTPTNSITPMDDHSKSNTTNDNNCNTSATSANNSDNSWIDEVKVALSEDDGNPIRAQSIYERHYVPTSYINKTTANDDTNISLLYQIQADLFDSWIHYQRELLDVIPTKKTEFTHQPMEQDHTTNDMHHTISLLYQAAECSNNLLEHMVPFFSPRNEYLTNLSMMMMMMSPSPGTNDNSSIDGLVGQRNTYPTNDNRVSRRSMYDSKNQNTNIPINVEITNKCNLVLQAWAQCSQVGYDYHIHKTSNNKSTLIRCAIPQRAQFLLERMEVSYENAALIMKKMNEKLSNQQLEQLEGGEHFDGSSSTANSIDEDNDDDSNLIIVRPTMESYISVINAWGYSQEHLRGARAEQIFQKLLSFAQHSPTKKRNNNRISYDEEEEDEKNRIVADAYRCIMRAWSYSNRDDRAAFNATGHLMKVLRVLANGDNKHMEPSLEDYKIILRAWTKSKDRNAAGKAQSILKLMEYAKRNGSTTIQPDVECYRYVLITASKRSRSEHRSMDFNDILASSKVVEDCFTKMKSTLIVPDSLCYGSAIRAWRNVAITTNDANTNGTTYNNDSNGFVAIKNIPSSISYLRDKAARRAYDLLMEMPIAHNRSSLHSIRVSTSHVNDVIEALASISNTTRKWIEKAEQFLMDMEENLLKSNENGDDGNDYTWAKTKPNPDTYRHVINLWKTSDLRERISRSKAVLYRFKDNYVTNLSTTEKTTYNRDDKLVSVLNAFIDVCSRYDAVSNEEGMEILKEALLVIEIMKPIMDVKPNSVTYSLLLSACENLLSKGEERQRFIELIFNLCCNDGLVDDNVLIRFKSAAAPDQYTKMVIAVSEDIGDGTSRIIPEAWTINALGGRVLASDGRRTKPLSIDGRITVTKAMQEFKMRRLRDQRNRKLLEGGRLHGSRLR